MTGYYKLIFTFFVFALIGWLIELVFRSIYEKRIVNPGFHKGPWLPLYGLTGIMILLVSEILVKQSLLVRMLFYFVLSSAIELSAGIFLEKAFGRRYWDYTPNKFNIMGYICPLYSCGWVLICLGVESFLIERVKSVVQIIPLQVIFSIDIFLLITFSVDFLISSGILKNTIFFFRSRWKTGR